MDYVLASNGLAPWGQAAAIVLALYLFISIIVGLALVAVLLFGFAWIREKAELVRQLRPQVTQLNRATVAVKRGNPLPHEVADNKVVAAVAQAPRMVDNVAARASDIERQVEQNSQRVANAVIELHARTAMVKGMARAFFLPGLTKTRPVVPVVQVIKQKAEPEPVVAVQNTVEEQPMEQEIVITQYIR